MISTRWLEKRRAHWTRLEQLVASSGGKNVTSLSPTELQELALLYRQTASDLSTVREDPTSAQLARYLNQLLGRAHNLIYMGRKSERKGIWTFYKVTYPKIFRETFPDTFAAFVLFLIAAVAGFLVSVTDPSFVRHVIGPQMIDTIEHHKMWTDSIVGVQPQTSSAIMTNNLTVSFAAFAMGITAGVGTVYMMLFNGLLIGVIGEACWREGMSLQLWSFVAAHGVLELPAIFIAGGAGLGIAKGLLFPGVLSRGESLARAGARSVRLVLGIIPLLIIAGTIEGFVSPTSLSPYLKFALAAALFTMLAMYLSSSKPETDIVASTGNSSVKNTVPQTQPAK